MNSPLTKGATAYFPGGKAPVTVIDIDKTGALVQWDGGMAYVPLIQLTTRP